MKRKRPQKKVVVKKTEWLEKPVDQECQEGKIDKITFQTGVCIQIPCQNQSKNRFYYGGKS